MREFKVGDRLAWDGGSDAGAQEIIVTGFDKNKYVKFKDQNGKARLRHPSEFMMIEPSPDTINHPDHYAGSNGIECIDAMRATLTPEEFRGYCKGAAFKYIWRERQKGGNESLAKAVWYLNEAQK